MSDKRTEIAAELSKIEQAIAAQEALRGLLPDEQIDAVLAVLREQAASIRARLDGDGAIAQEGGVAAGAGGVAVKGNVRGGVTLTEIHYHGIKDKGGAIPPLPRPCHNLPHPDYGVFVGREEELAQVHRILRPYPHSQHALVTIDGVGGIGKSALALEVAHRYLRDYDRLPQADRFEAIIWTAAKSSVLTADGIIPRQQVTRTLQDIYTTIAATLEREDITRVRVDERDKLVAKALTQQRTLLIVDNLETVDDERVNAFLRELPAPTKAIVTTRHRIDVAYPVRLVGMPWETAQTLIAQECSKKGIHLNTSESRRLYDRTGGVPLAIVWSIARMGMGYGIDTVLARLGRPTDDIARYCFEEALEHISERDAHKVLTALAVLAGGTTREMLGVIVGLDEDMLSRDEALVELERLSLVTRQDDKWHLLPLVKQYALETCSPEYRDEYLLRAAESYCDFVHRHVSDERVRPIGRSAYDALEAERLNIFGLIEWCYENELWELVVQLVLGMGYFPHARGYWQDAVKYWGIGASAGQLLDNQLVFARCTTYLGYMHFFQGDFAEAEKCARRASLVVDELEPSYQLASVRRLQGYLATARGVQQDAVGLLNESLSLMRQMKSAHGTSRVLGDLGELAYRTGDYAAAERHLSESLSIAEAHDDRTEIIRGLRHLGELARLDGRCEEARIHYQQSLVAAQETGWWDEISQVKHGLAQLEWQCGNHELANGLALEALAIYEQLGQNVKSSEVQSMLSNWETIEES